MLFLDLDRFKEVNDTLGHKVGDGLLKGVADRLRDLMPPETVLARIGGDEFAAILKTSPIRPIDDLAIAIVESIYEPFMVDNHLVHVGASVGVAKGMRPTACADDLLRQADIAMYDAKFSKTELVPDLRRADEQDGRVAVEHARRARAGDPRTTSSCSIPAADRCPDRRISSVEALLRWPNSSQGEISPTDLIPLAEESGQILALGNWVLDKAIEVARELETVPVAVNVSPIQFRHHGFATTVGDKLLAAGVVPELLRIEITEGVLIFTSTRPRARSGSCGCSASRSRSMISGPAIRASAIFKISTSTG